MREVIVSGLTATGKLTLGNYIGAIKNLKKMQELDNDIYMFVADLHALTLPIDPETLRNNIRENLKLYLSIGIDPNKTKLFIQSNIQEHSELFYLLNTISYQGELNRMTQFKDKIKNLTKKEAKNGVPVGLYIYPLLMAADIMIYNPTKVIVGDDQKQHLELTRNLIERMNTRYGLNFNIPEPLIQDVGSRIMSLKNPTSKMSKSDKDINNTIFLLDNPEVIKSKISSSLTDSENKVYYDLENKPGVSNLINIYSSLKEITIKEAESNLSNLDYKSFKEEIAKTIIEVLEPIQDKYKNLSEEHVDNALKLNLDNIKTEAKNNIQKIYKGIGLR